MNMEGAVLVLSLLLLTAGAAMAWMPLGPIVLGTLLLAGLVWTRLRPVVPRNPETEEE